MSDEALERDDETVDARSDWELTVTSATLPSISAWTASIWSAEIAWT